jgi:hypothetical protein
MCTENVKSSLNIHFDVPRTLPPWVAAQLFPPPAKPLKKITLLLGHKYRCSNCLFLRVGFRTEVDLGHCFIQQYRSLTGSPAVKVILSFFPLKVYKFVCCYINVFRAGSLLVSFRLITRHNNVVLCLNYEA